MMQNNNRAFDKDEPRPKEPSPVGPFKLYPEERHWWSFNDYGAVLKVMRELNPKRVLEFGPGSSTLALIEGGATTIDTVEDNPDWAEVYEKRLAGKYPDIVKVHRYEWADPLSIANVDGEQYDLALIDGPLGSDRRADAVRYALARSKAVLAPTEDANPKVRQALIAMAKEMGLHIEIWETGPLSGGFALITKPVVHLPGEHSEKGHTAPAPVTEVREVLPVDLEIQELPVLQTPEDGLTEAIEAPAPRLSKRERKKKREQENQS